MKEDSTKGQGLAGGRREPRSGDGRGQRSQCVEISSSPQSWSSVYPEDNRAERGSGRVRRAQPRMLLPRQPVLWAPSALLLRGASLLPRPNQVPAWAQNLKSLNPSLPAALDLCPEPRVRRRFPDGSPVSSENEAFALHLGPGCWSGLPEESDGAQLREARVTGERQGRSSQLHRQQGDPCMARPSFRCSRDRGSSPPGEGGGSLDGKLLGGNIRVGRALAKQAHRVFVRQAR